MEIQFKEISYDNLGEFSISYSTMVATIKNYGDKLLSVPGINGITISSDLSAYVDDIEAYKNMKVFETVYPVSGIKHASFKITDPNTFNIITTLNSCSLKLQVFVDQSGHFMYARTVGCNNVVECGFELFQNSGIDIKSYAFSNGVSDKVGKYMLESPLNGTVLVDLDEMTAHTLYANKLVRGHVNYVYNPESLRGKIIEGIHFI